MKTDFEKLYYIVYDYLHEESCVQVERLELLMERNSRIKNESKKGHRRRVSKYTVYCIPDEDNMISQDVALWSKSYRTSEVTWRNLYDFCEVLGIDLDRLVALTKSITKWHEKNGWQRSFPFESHEGQIVKYVKTQ